MDEAEKYKQRLQAISEKRRLQEEEDKVRREMEEDWLKLAQHKRKSQREQWLMEATPSMAEDPRQQPVVPTPATTGHSAEEEQSSHRQIKTEVERTEVVNEESSQIEENEPSVHSADSTDQPGQAYLREEERNVPGVLEVDEEGNLLSNVPQEDTEEKGKAKTGEQKTDQLALDVAEHTPDLPLHSLQQNEPPDEAHFSLADEKTEQTIAEDDAEVEEEEEWEMVNCSPEEVQDLVLRSQTDSELGLKDDEAVLKVEQIFIMGEEEDIESGEPEVLSLVMAETKSDLEDASCESRSASSKEDRPPEGASQTLCLEKSAGTSEPLRELSNVSGIISEEPLVHLVECRQNLPHLTAHTAHTIDEIRDNTEYKGDQSISASRMVEVEWNEITGLEDEKFHYVSLDRKSPSMLQRKMVAQSTEQESEIQILMPPSVTPNRAETVTSANKKLCHCCTVM